MNGTCDIVLGGETLQLLPERAVLWSSQATLFVADLHFGKTAAFRSLGVAAPDTTDADLDRLTGLVSLTRARRLVLLGDFSHARIGWTPTVAAALIQWRRVHAALEIDLVIGNHDRSTGDLPSGLGIRRVESALEVGPLVCRHEPPASPDGRATLCGHVHPGVRLRERNGAGLRLPCFVHEGSQLILPAFGAFTGLSLQTPAPGRSLFAVAEGTVLPLHGPRRPQG